MKKIVASVGLVAVGVSGAFAAYTPGLSTMDTSKPWSVTASLRGFYDDNYLLMPSDERDTFGFNVSPSVRLNMPLDQTYLGARAIYSGRYYADRDRGSNDPWDHSFQFDAMLNHAFNERYSLDVRDAFVIAQEPEALAVGGGGAITFPYRTDGSNIRNHGQIAFKAQMTRLLGLDVSYNNVFWDYDSKNGTPQNPSYSARLDRVEHLATLELGWQALPETRISAGYKFGAVQYSSDELIDPLLWYIPAFYQKADFRDNRSHYLYAGVMQNFARNLTASASIGATYIDYVNDTFNSDTWIPYANVSAAYSYMSGSSVQVGFLHSFNQTDRFDSSSQQSSTFFGAINQQITPKLQASLRGHYQTSEFDGGLYDGSSDQILMLGVNLAYAITPHWSAEVGYNFDDLSSDGAHNDYNRNRLYIGVTASY